MKWLPSRRWCWRCLPQSVASSEQLTADPPLDPPRPTPALPTPSLERGITHLKNDEFRRREPPRAIRWFSKPSGDAHYRPASPGREAQRQARRRRVAKKALEIDGKLLAGGQAANGATN
jgi:hypothetical protein